MTELISFSEYPKSKTVEIQTQNSSTDFNNGKVKNKFISHLKQFKGVYILFGQIVPSFELVRRLNS